MPTNLGLAMGMLSLGGRARRRDYLLVNVLLGVVPTFVGTLFEHQIKSAFDQLPDVVGLAVALTFLLCLVGLAWVVGLTLPVRRLHDMNLSGWYYLLIVALNVVPYAGTLVVFVWLAFVKGSKGRNRYGSDPRGPLDRDLVQVFDGPPVSATPSRPSPPR